MHDTISGQVAALAQCLNLVLRCAGAKIQIFHIGPDVPRDSTKLVSSFRKRCLLADMRWIRQYAARIDRRHATAQARKECHALQRDLRTGLLFPRLPGERGIAAIEAIEQRITETDERFGYTAWATDAAQRF